jgi:peptidyl-prolyl cis-trans isomerase B (cyclophilin B)
MADRTATFETNKGAFVAQLFETDAPTTTGNFIQLAEKGFYNGLTFHRYVEGFVIQGGDPSGDGTGGSGRNIPLEVSPKLKHDQAGVMAMARSPHPDSASSQFYFTLKATPHLDGDYAVFGRIVTGLDVMLSLRAGDRMDKVTISPQ